MKLKLIFVFVFFFSISSFSSNPYIEAAKSFPIKTNYDENKALEDENTIKLKFYSIDIEKAKEQKLEKFEGEKYFLLKIGNVKPFEISNVVKKQSFSIDRIYDDIFIAKLNEERVYKLKKAFPNSIILEYKPSYKVHPSLLNSNWKEPVIIETLLQKGEKLESLKSEISKHFFIGSLSDEKKGFRLRWLVNADKISDFVKELANFNEVMLVYPWFLPSPLNDDSIWVIQSYDTTNKRDYSKSAVMFNHGILGEGEIATVCDTGLDNDMCYFSYDNSGYSLAQYPTLPQTGVLDFSKKVICYSVLPNATAYDNDSSCGVFNQFHGTHTSGTLVGDNFADLSSLTNIGHDTADGMAPMAKLYFQDAGEDESGCLSGLANDFYLILKQSYSAGARIHSNSWGSEANGDYTTDSLVVDDFCYENDDFVICFAAGNSGFISQTINSPATAKNCITVGSLTNGSIGSNKVSDFSSKGPTKDGRIKPDLCAPGENILSASGTKSSEDRNCTFKPMSGTSMATPTLAGGATLLRNYFTKGFYPSGEENIFDSFNPSSALIKSALISGAMDVENRDFPNFLEGFGRVNLDRFCYFKRDEKDNLRSALFDVRNYAGIKEGEEMAFSIPVKGYLKVSLVWTDPPASPIALKTLVNDLDLKIISPTQEIYYGNNFLNGYSVPNGTADSKNNVEMVLLENCEEGIWKIVVVGKDIKGKSDLPYSDRQGFALTYVKEYGESPQNSPQNLTLYDDGQNGVKVEWSFLEGADYYSVYRIEQSGDNYKKQTFLGQTSQNNFFDNKVQGGFSYTYFVRGVKNGFEGESSERKTITFTGNCTMLPDFSGIKDWQNDNSTEECDVILYWDEANSNCPLNKEIGYNIYRESYPNFSPSSSNIIAKRIKNLFYKDIDILPNTTSYYIVRSEDSTTLNSGPSNGGNEDKNLNWVNATPFGNEERLGDLFDDGGDSIALLKIEKPFTISTLQNHSPNGNYCYSISKEGEPYPNSTCASLYSPHIKVASKESELSYYVKYNLEYGWDGVVVEISENGGNSFLPSTPKENYPSSFFLTGSPPINSCSYPSNQGCFTGPQLNDSLTEWQRFSHDLGNYLGKEIVVRWRFSSDPAAQFEGFFLDDIEFKNVNFKSSCESKIPTLNFDKMQYKCYEEATISLRFLEKKGANKIDCFVQSTSEETPEKISLNESPSNSGNFYGTIQLSEETTIGDGKVGVKDEDIITATVFEDTNSYFSNSLIDCKQPEITLLSISFSSANTLEIYFSTSEQTSATLSYGEDETLLNHLEDKSFSLSHRFTLSSLSFCTQYFYKISIEDYAGNGNFSPTKTFNTKYCYPQPKIEEVKILKDPFRLAIIGDNFMSDSKILIDDDFVPQTVFKSSQKLIAKKGNSLKRMVPKGKTVKITVINQSDMTKSEPFYFSR